MNICKSCQREYAVNKKKNDREDFCSRCIDKSRRLKRKLRLIEYMGGKCSKCGYKKCPFALEFHHVDPSTKSFNVSQMLVSSWDKLMDEVAKCILVCGNCHAEIEYMEHPDRDKLMLIEHFSKDLRIDRESNTQLRLTDEQVTDIKQSKKRTTALCKEYGLSKVAIRNIRHNRTYKDIDVDDPYVYDGSRLVGEDNPRSTLTVNQVKQIKIRLDSNMTINQIAKEFDVAWSTINNIKIGKTWSHLNID